MESSLLQSMFKRELKLCCQQKHCISSLMLSVAETIPLKFGAIIEAIRAEENRKDEKIYFIVIKRIIWEEKQIFEDKENKRR